MASQVARGPTDPEDTRDAILRTEQLTKRYGELAAVDAVDFKVERGTVHSVIGPNGAGKTTLIDLISGGRPPTAGRIYFNGRDITDLSAHERVHAGLARSFQITTLFDELTLEENLRIAVQAGAYGDLSVRDAFIADTSRFAAVAEKTRSVMERLGLDDNSEMPTRSLPYGDRRKLEIGVVMATDPELVLLDEPTAGMSPDRAREMMALVEDVLSDATLVVVEHDVELLMEISDYLTVLHAGRILAEGPPDAIAENAAVQEAYLGGEL